MTIERDRANGALLSQHHLPTLPNAILSHLSASNDVVTASITPRGSSDTGWALLFFRRTACGRLAPIRAFGKDWLSPPVAGFDSDRRYVEVVTIGGNNTFEWMTMRKVNPRIGWRQCELGCAFGNDTGYPAARAFHFAVTPELPSSSSSACGGGCVGDECEGEEPADGVSIGGGGNDDNDGSVSVPVATAAGEVELIAMDEEMTREDADAKCSGMGGSLARYEVAPEQLRELAEEYGELHVVEDSNGSHSPWLDQSSNPPCIDSATSMGFCSCCLHQDSRKKFVCCVGDECNGGSGESDGGDSSVAAALAPLAAAAVAMTVHA